MYRDTKFALNVPWLTSLFMPPFLIHNRLFIAFQRECQVMTGLFLFLAFMYQWNELTLRQHLLVVTNDLNEFCNEWCHHWGPIPRSWLPNSLPTRAAKKMKGHLVNAYYQLWRSLERNDHKSKVTSLFSSPKWQK